MFRNSNAQDNEATEMQQPEPKCIKTSEVRIYIRNNMQVHWCLLESALPWHGGVLRLCIRNPFLISDRLEPHSSSTRTTAH